MNQDQQLWVYDKLYGITDGSLRRITIRELRKMIRLIRRNNSILQNLSQSNLNRYINTQGIYGISVLMILGTNNIREQERIQTDWVNAARYAITLHSNNNSNSNNTTTINSKRSSGTKLSTPTRKRIKKTTATTPQSKLRKSPKK